MKKVYVQGKTYEINKIPMKKYSQVMKAISGLPNKIIDVIMNIDTNEDNNMINETSSAIQHLFNDEVFEFVSVASDIDKEIIEEIGLDEFLPLFNAILEINNLKVIIEEVKKSFKILMTLFQAQTK